MIARRTSRFEGTKLLCYSSLLNLRRLDRNGGLHCHDVFIRGKGIIVSGGKELAHNVIEQEKENMRDYLRSLGDKILECEKEAYPYV